MTKIRPIQFDSAQELEQLKVASQNKSDYIDGFKSRFYAALPNVSPKVNNLLNEALATVHKKIKEPSFLEAIQAAEAQGPDTLSKFCAKFRHAVSLAIPSQFPVVMEMVTRNVRETSALGTVSMVDRPVPEVSIEQTYFGALLYKHGLHTLLSAVSDLANGNIAEKVDNFEHRVGGAIQHQIAGAQESLRNIKLLNSDLYNLRTAVRRISNYKVEYPLSKNHEFEHKSIYSAMFRGIGPTGDSDGLLLFSKDSDLDNVRKMVNRVINENSISQKNNPDLLSMSNALVGVEGSMGSLHDAPKSVMSRISKSFKSIFADPDHEKASSNKPSAP